MLLTAGAYIFAASAHGKFLLRPDVVTRRFRFFREEAGVGGVPLYALRHQPATTMIDAGVIAKTASDQLGNSVATMLSRRVDGRKPMWRPQPSGKPLRLIR